MTDLLNRAQSRGEVLRYVGVVDPKEGCSVELKSYSRSHAFAGTSGSDNIVAFQTKRCYQDRKSTRLNSSHLGISYAVFCLKKKKKTKILNPQLYTSAKHTIENYV